MFFLWFITYYTSLCQLIGGTIAGILYPRDSETREVKSLDGIWNFKLQPPNDSFVAYNEKWFTKELKDSGITIPMPVPASYNDITVDKDIRDFVGVAWYDRKFFVPKSWGTNQTIWLRFGSVCYAAQVYLNGDLVTAHEVGHLPFAKEITDKLTFGEENLITVSVDNVLLETTIPQGTVAHMVINNSTVLHQYYSFDFFNYAGIDRPVLLYTTPEIYIDDISVLTDVSDGDGIIYFKVEYNLPENEEDVEKLVSCYVTLSDKERNEIQSIKDCAGKFIVPSAKLWWPFLMHSEPGYLYQLKVELLCEDGLKDVYRLPVGIRKITWSQNELLINGKPIYIRGVGKHEDFFIKGKGLDLSLAIRDFELMKWVGINTFRTSHYPYAEEIMDLADSQGIMVIDECPSVDTEKFSSTLLKKHKQSLTELFQRDKNRPSVIMWSVANEPRSHVDPSDAYFKEIVNHIKSLDSTRPITAAISRHVQEDKAAKHLDVIAFNRYNSWYSNPGMTEVIFQNVIREAENWNNMYKKPIIMSEYGADTLPGMHYLPERVWSEDYQSVMLEEHFKAFDYLRSQKFFVGEMIWNFADFQTAQTPNRAGGNKKGIFTRQREPKASAFYLRKRYHQLAYYLDGAPLPNDLFPYITSFNASNFEE